jgi:hypothetical protein
VNPLRTTEIRLIDVRHVESSGSGVKIEFDDGPGRRVLVAEAVRRALVPLMLHRTASIEQVAATIAERAGAAQQ